MQMEGKRASLRGVVCQVQNEGRLLLHAEADDDCELRNWEHFLLRLPNGIVSDYSIGFWGFGATDFVKHSIGWGESVDP